MSITTMTNQEKATQNPAAATEAPVKTEVAHWLNKKDENTFSEFYFMGVVCRWVSLCFIELQFNFCSACNCVWGGGVDDEK